jgi:hypothetical protein
MSGGDFERVIAAPSLYKPALRRLRRIYIGYTGCPVSSVTRRHPERGSLGGAKLDPDAPRLAAGYVDTTGTIMEPTTVIAQLVDDRGMAIEYRNLSEAIRAVKAAAGIP